MEITDQTDINSQSQAVEPQDALLEDMIKAGVIYGRKKSILHPSARKFIAGIKEAVTLFDLSQTLSAIDDVAKFLKGLIEQKKMVLMVGTWPGIKEVVAEFAKKYNFPYAINRWLGGAMTNFKAINGRLQYYLNLKKDFEAGKYDKYPKKERVKLQHELEKLNIRWTGLEKFDRLPDVIFVVDVNEHLTAVKEAVRLSIPIIAIANSNTNFGLINYPIPANSRAPASVKWILNKLQDLISQK